MKPILISVHWTYRRHWHASSIGVVQHLSLKQQATLQKHLDTFISAVERDLGRPEGVPETMKINHPGAPAQSKFGAGKPAGVSLPPIMWEWLDTIPQMPSRNAALRHAIETHPGFQEYVKEEEAYQEAVSAEA